VDNSYNFPSTEMALWVLGTCQLLACVFSLRLLWLGKTDLFNKIFWSIVMLLIPAFGIFAWYAFEFDFRRRR